MRSRSWSQYLTFFNSVTITNETSIDVIAVLEHVGKESQSWVECNTVTLILVFLESLSFWLHNGYFDLPASPPPRPPPMSGKGHDYLNDAKDKRTITGYS